MAEDPIGWLHLLSAYAALVLGGVVVAMRKGTRLHRWLGRGFALAMVSVNVTALGIYDLTGRPNLFHFFAVISLLSLAAGWFAARRSGPVAREVHMRSMLWAYVGLLAAAASELIVRVPGVFTSWLSFGVAVGVATTLVCSVGAVLIERTVARRR